MSLFDPTLFLAYSCSMPFEKKLAKANPHLVDLFTQGDEYLTALSIGEQRLLGKPLTKPMSIESLEQLQKHVESLLKRLVPNDPYLPDHFLLACLIDGE